MCTVISIKKAPKILIVLHRILHEILQIVLRGYYEHSVFPFYDFPVPGTLGLRTSVLRPFYFG